MDTEHFEGDTFEVVMDINSDACYSQHIYFETDYEGYKQLTKLLEKLNPSKQVIE
jgi:hypothetical protein